jgi:AcrR family transcriptional regulator
MFCENGYQATTMNAIAEDAEVAVQTLYFTFHTKGALLGEALGAAIVGFDRWTKPKEPVDAAHDQKELLAWWPDFEAAPDPRKALAVFVENAVTILERVGPLLAAIHAAEADPDAAAVQNVAEQRRVASYLEIVGFLEKRHQSLRPGLSVERAADIMLVLLSPDLYRAMTEVRAWSPEECAAFLADLIIDQLVGR